MADRYIATEMCCENQAIDLGLGKSRICLVCDFGQVSSSFEFPQNENCVNSPFHDN